jgi:erythromycin esterase-like protein
MRRWFCSATPLTVLPNFTICAHYFYAVLPQQFDEYVWFDETREVTPLSLKPDAKGLSETFPFGV